MKTFIQLLILVAFVMIITTNISVAEEIIRRGVASNTEFQVVYIYETNLLSVESKGVSNKIPLAGSLVNEIYVKDIDSDGNDEVIFLDLSGISVGGDLRVFYWEKDKLKEISSPGFFANEFRLKQINGISYVTLWNHDTADLFFCDDVVVLKEKKIITENSIQIWSEIIASYRKSLLLEKEAWKKSRYYTYMAMAYEKIGDSKNKNKNIKKAKILDPANPFLK